MELDFYNACRTGNLTNVEKIITQNIHIHIHININWQNSNDGTISNLHGCTPLMWTCLWNNIKNIKILIASGINLNSEQKLYIKNYKSKYQNMTASEISRIGGYIEISCAKLVEAYVDNPKKITNELRRKLCWTAYEAELLA